jgi:NADPH:quinone reductase-like Zn-dependent oxidoreductase
VRAVVFDRYGPPDVLRVEEVEQPVPRDDEVLVKVRATTVSRADCATREANRRSGLLAGLLSRLFFGIRRPRRRILGSELSGEVAAVGGAVREFAVGDRVFGTSGLRFGAHAEFVCLPEGSSLAHMPAGLTYEQAAAVCDGGINALTSLRRAGVATGRTVLVYGASGSIGTAAVQLGRHFGAEVTAVCGTRNVETARSLGAARVIDYTRQDFTTGGNTYDVIFDAVGKQSFRRCRRSLTPGGIYIATDGFANAILGLVTSRVGDRKVVFPTPRLTKENVEFLKELIEAGGYRAVIDRSYPLEQVVEATRYVETEHKTGNVVLTVNAPAA